MEDIKTFLKRSCTDIFEKYNSADLHDSKGQAMGVQVWNRAYILFESTFR